MRSCINRLIKISAIALGLLILDQVVHAEPAKTLKDLISEVTATSSAESLHNQEREKRFLSEYKSQTSMLSQAQAEVAVKEKQRDKLKDVFDTNEKALGVLQEQLDRRTGDLGELFGVFRQTAGDTQSMIYDSLVSIEKPERIKTIADLASSKDVPTIAEIESLWAILLDEIAGSAEVSKFKSNVVKPSGEMYSADVIRVGTFNVVADDKYLRYSPEDEKLIELSRQPSGSITSTAERLANAEPGKVVGFSLDPSRGVLLSLLVQSPDLIERIEQGQLVGYAIITVGLIGLFIVVFRFYHMQRVSVRIKKQAADMDHFSTENPLGRVLNAFYENRALSADVISRKLDDVIFKDASEFRKGTSTIKVLAAIAPLMGLLGTVTGMIGTFQAITLFGTGDPKLMASGISQALVTTVLGLVVSIPLLLSHSLLSGRAILLTKLLGEQAAGMVAEQAEKMEMARSSKSDV